MYYSYENRIQDYDRFIPIRFAVKSRRTVYEAYLKQLNTIEKWTRVQCNIYKEIGLLEQRKRENLRSWRQMIKEEPSACVSGRTSAPGIVHAAPAPVPVVRSDRSVSVGTAAASRARRLLKKSRGTKTNSTKVLWTPSDSVPNGASSADPDPAEASLSDTNESLRMNKAKHCRLSIH